MINSYIYRFKELGYDYTQLDKDQKNNNEEGNVNNDEKKD